MKLPSKYIVLLVVASLIGILAYQGYWLMGLYHTMHGDMERGILEAMRMSDYNEMIMRVERLKRDDTDHGEVSVSAGYSHNDGRSFVHSSTTISSKSSSGNDTLRQTIISEGDSTRFIDRDKEPDDSSRSALSVKEGLDVILRDQSSMLELATYFQRGLHSGLDIISEPDVALYDSLLTSLLCERGIRLPHKLMYLHEGGQEESGTLFTDTLASIGTPGYVPGPKAVAYDYAFDINVHHSYRLLTEPIDMLVLRQMSGILATSFVILVILAFSFWFLIRTILKQKTLEEMKSDFTNNITHELKTPIAVAYAANDALLNFDRAEEKAQRDKYLRICQEQLRRLSGLVEQILSMSMERRKTFRLHPEEFAIRDMLETLIEQHTLKAEKPVRITTDIEPEDLSVLADPTHFGNIFSNLIDNAIKYSRGEAEVAIHCRKATDKEGNEQTEISVTDHGIGIASEKQKHIFDKFYRVPTGNLHDVKGYGLGLFYVKSMVEKHGGTVSVKSEPGRGSTFTIRCPQPRAHAIS